MVSQDEGPQPDPHSLEYLDLTIESYRKQREAAMAQVEDSTQIALKCEGAVIALEALKIQMYPPFRLEESDLTLPVEGD